MWITGDLYGVIRFKTCSFELSLLESPETRVFWRYLCETCQLDIEPESDLCRIEFSRPLFDYL